jgi:hypothetical protein
MPKQVNHEELNALIATEVMGWEVHERNSSNYVSKGNANALMTIETVRTRVADWNPTTDERHAFQALKEWEAKEPLKRSIVIDTLGLTNDWRIRLDEGPTANYPSHYAEGESLPAAISLALAAAYGHDVELKEDCKL